jgi:hypothetical protein
MCTGTLAPHQLLLGQLRDVGQVSAGRLRGCLGRTRPLLRGGALRLGARRDAAASGSLVAPPPLRLRPQSGTPLSLRPHAQSRVQRGGGTLASLK